MVRKLVENELVIASHNKGKLREIEVLLKSYIAQFYGAGDLDLPEPEETGITFEENAILKARAAAKLSGKPALADDSGLAVNALGGAPGIYSARWGGPAKDFGMAMTRIHKELGDSKDRSAAFICVLALAWPDGHAETFYGEVRGTLIWPVRGAEGFGYDPMFVPEGHDVTFAEMDLAQKQTMSHRARAFEKLVKAIF